MNSEALYRTACQRTGLDPDGRFLYVARDGRNLRVELTIDGFRLVAERTGKYRGQLGPFWCGPDGKWASIWTGSEPPHAARVGILRDGFAKPIWGKVLYAEFVQDSEFWRKMPANQLAKCAEAAGFRRAFPAEFSGLYSPDELPVAIPMAVPERQVIQNGEVAINKRAKSEFQPLGTSGQSSEGQAVECPQRGGGPCAIPAPLQPFVEAGMGRKNIKACEDFLRGELQAVLGREEGRRQFLQIWASIPRTFKSKEEARAATVASWVQMWALVEAGKPERRAA